MNICSISIFNIKILIVVSNIHQISSDTNHTRILPSTSTNTAHQHVITLPYGQHQGGQLQQAGQGGQGQGSGGRRACSERANQGGKEAGQGQGQENKTAEENIQEGAEGGAGEGLHLSLVHHLGGGRTRDEKLEEKRRLDQP